MTNVHYRVKINIGGFSLSTVGMLDISEQQACTWEVASPCQNIKEGTSSVKIQLLS